MIDVARRLPFPASLQSGTYWYVDSVKDNLRAHKLACHALGQLWEKSGGPGGTLTGDAYAKSDALGGQRIVTASQDCAARI